MRLQWLALITLTSVMFMNNYYKTAVFESLQGSL